MKCKHCGFGLIADDFGFYCRNNECKLRYVSQDGVEDGD